MKIKNKKGLLMVALASNLMLNSSATWAMGLLQAYDAALQNDPTYRSALYDSEAGKQYVALGRSNLLPNVSINYANSRNRTDITTPNFLGAPTTTHPEYSSTIRSISMRQPILNLDGVARYHQGLIQTNYSQAQFVGRGQELILRLVGAYFDALFAQDQLALASAQRDTLIEQRRVNDRMFQQGEASKTDMLEIQARLDLAQAQVIEAQDNLTVASNTFSTIIGSDVSVANLDQMKDDFRFKSLSPADFDAWKALAMANNAELALQRYTVDAALQDINKNRAGHTPRLDFVASYSQNDAESVNTYNQDSVVRSVGIQLNIPLYAGGAVSAATTQSVANYERAKADMSAKVDKVMLDLRKQYNLVLSSVNRIDALVKGLNSARLLVVATEKSVKGGVRINLDVLNAQQQLYTVQRDLAQARYSYLLAYLRLRSAAGTLSAEDVQEMAGYFKAAS